MSEGKGRRKYGPGVEAVRSAASRNSRRKGEGRRYKTASATGVPPIRAAGLGLARNRKQ